jgi:hypothetical protein
MEARCVERFDRGIIEIRGELKVNEAQNAHAQMKSNNAQMPTHFGIYWKGWKMSCPGCEGEGGGRGEGEDMLSISVWSDVA